MRFDAFLEELSWELSSTVRCPVFEVLTGFFAFMGLANIVMESEICSAPLRFLLADHCLLLMNVAFTTVRSSFIVIFLLSSILTATVFTRSRESGHLRDELSLPVDEGVLFVAKLASVFLSLFLSVVVSVVACLLFLEPIRGILEMLSPYMVEVLAGIATEIALPVGISALIAVLSRSSLFSMMSSFMLLTGLYLMAPEISPLNLISPTTLGLVLIRADVLEILQLMSIKWAIFFLLIGISCLLFERGEVL